MKCATKRRRNKRRRARRKGARAMKRFGSTMGALSEMLGDAIEKAHELEAVLTGEPA